MTTPNDTGADPAGEKAPGTGSSDGIKKTYEGKTLAEMTPEEKETYLSDLNSQITGLEGKRDSMEEEVSNLRRERRTLKDDPNPVAAVEKAPAEAPTEPKDAPPKVEVPKKEDPLKELKEQNTRAIFGWLYQSFPELDPTKDTGNRNYNHFKRFLPSDFSVLNTEQAKDDLRRAYAAAFPDKIAEIQKSKGRVEERQRQFTDQMANIGGTTGNDDVHSTPGNDPNKPTKEDEAAAARAGIPVDKYMKGKNLGWNWEEQIIKDDQ